MSNPYALVPADPGAEQQPLNNCHRQTQREKSPTSSTSSNRGHARVLESKFKQHYTTWILAFVAASSLAVSTWIIHATFISREQVPSYLRLSQGHTVALVTILTQSVIHLVLPLVDASLEALRWSLASRPTGILALSFLAMSRATGFLGVLDLLRVPGWHRIWSVQRALFKSLSILTSLILLSSVTYTTIYIPDSSSVLGVIAGLAALNAYLNVPQSMLSMYILMYTENILRDTTTVTGIAPISCSGSGCTSIYLPGGINLVRLAKGGPSATLFGAKLPDGPIFLVYEAPGYQIEFSPIWDEYNFNSTDCKTYGGASGLAIYICIAAEGTKILASWSICPSDLYLHGLCLTNTHWKYQPVASTVLVLHKRYSTVAYDRNNLSIISIESISDPVPPTEISTMELAQNLTHLLDLIFSPIPNSLNITDPLFPVYDLSFGVEFTLGWVLRLYQDDYQNYPGGPLAVLQGFLTVPLQFSTTAWQWASWDTLPSDLRTTASLAWPEDRALGSLWMLIVFAIAAGVPILWATIVMTWVCIWGPNCPNMSKYPELDIVAKASMAETGSPGNWKYDAVMGLESLARYCGMGNGVSSIVRRHFVGKRLFVGAVRGRIVLVTEEGKAEKLKIGESYY